MLESFQMLHAAGSHDDGATSSIRQSCSPPVSCIDVLKPEWVARWSDMLRRPRVSRGVAQTIDGVLAAGSSCCRFCSLVPLVLDVIVLLCQCVAHVVRLSMRHSCPIARTDKMDHAFREQVQSGSQLHDEGVRKDATPWVSAHTPLTRTTSRPAVRADVSTTCVGGAGS